MTTTCLEAPQADDVADITHAWASTGLDVIDGTLCSTRRCSWCAKAQHKRYGAGGRKPWKNTTTTTSEVAR